MDAVICAVCVFLLLAWVQDHRRDIARRRRWEIRPDMTLEEELEIRRRRLEDLDRD
jgi:hypothetical protein